MRFELTGWLVEWGGVLIIGAFLVLFLLEFVLDHLLRKAWFWLFHRKPKERRFPWSDRNAT